MKFWSVVSLEHEPSTIAADVRDQVDAEYDEIDLVVAFVRPSAGVESTAIIEAVRESIPGRHFLACTAESVVAAGREIEHGAATGLLVGSLPNVEIEPLIDIVKILEDPETAGVKLDGAVAVIALLDPFTVEAETLAARMNDIAPGVPLVGGVASGEQTMGGNRLACGTTITNRGAVGLALRGQVDLSVVVSQGCRPVGPVYTVTGVQGNLITGLDDRSPLDALQGVFTEAIDRDQDLMRAGVMVGRAISPDPSNWGRDGFLVRGLMGGDQESGALAVAGAVRERDAVQFHVRDAATAQEDLEMLLTPQAFEPEAAGALLFTCNGRGTRMYGKPDGDISIIRQALGKEVPVSGFFCGGEMGPVGGDNFVHGYTASMAIFRPRSG